MVASLFLQEMEEADFKKGGVMQYWKNGIYSECNEFCRLPSETAAYIANSALEPTNSDILKNC